MPDVYPDDFVGPLPDGAVRESEYYLQIFGDVTNTILHAAFIMGCVLLVAVAI